MRYLLGAVSKWYRLTWNLGRSHLTKACTDSRGLPRCWVAWDFHNTATTSERPKQSVDWLQFA